MINNLPQIQALKREEALSIRRILGKIWDEECSNLNISSDFHRGLRLLVDRLFDPKKKLSSISSQVELLPDISYLFPILSDDVSLEELQEKGFIRLIKTRESQKVTITAEGLILLNLFEYSHISGGHYYLNSELLSERLTELINVYNSILAAQLGRLESSYRQKLNNAEIGLLLFFIVNGSVGADKVCRNINENIAQTIEQIVRAYAATGKSKINEYNWRGWYLTEANRKLGAVIVNKEPIYYMKPEALFKVEEAIISRVTNSNESFSCFIKGWKRLIEEYQKGRPILEKFRIAHFSQSRIDSLYDRIRNVASDKGLVN